MKLKKLVKPGFLQALGVTLYCLGVGLIFWKGGEFLGQPGYFGPVMVIVLFVVSALICALIVFYQPYKLFFEDKKREAIDLVVATTVWLFFAFLVFLLLAAL